MEAVGHVVGLLGEVRAESEAGLRPLQLGSEVYPDDILLTNQGAHVEVRFADQSVLSQGENARLTIDSFVYSPQDSAASNMVLNMAEGTFRMVTGEIAASNPEGVSMVSPLATIGIRGTGADLQVGEDGLKVGIFQYDGKDLTVTTPYGTMIINNANLILDVFADGTFGELRTYTDFEKAFFDAIAPILSIPTAREGGEDDGGDDGDEGDGPGDGTGNGDGEDGGGGEDEVTVELNPEDGASEGDILSFIMGAMEEILGDDTLAGGAGGDTLGGGDSVPGSGDGSPFDPDNWGQPDDPFADSLAGGDDDDDDTVSGGDTGDGDTGDDTGGHSGGSGGGSSSASCDCPAPASLDGTTGYTIVGDEAGTTFGADFAWVGDVNGDGIDDFMISAANADPNGVNNAGETYLIFGGTNLENLDAADGTTDGSIDISYLDGSNGYVLDGYRYEGRFGAYGRNKNMSTVGDFNNDGYDDFSLGATSFSTATGEGYVLFGGSSLAALDAMDGTADGTLNVKYLASGNGGDGSNGFILNGFTTYDQGGSSASYGDINGDGFSDVIQSGFMAGSTLDSGEVYVVFGGNGWSGGAELSQNGLNGTNGVFFYNSNAREFMGNSVTGIPDMNGDGFAEVLIGANEGHGSNADRTGKAYLVFGGSYGVKGESSVLSGGFNVSGLDGSNGYLFEGVDNQDVTGQVSYADVNGDGISDLIIGAPESYTGQYGPGKVFVVYGDQLAALDAADGSGDGTIQLSKLLATNGADGTYGYVMAGNAGSTDRLGFSVQTAGDVNNDGYGDFMVGGHTVAANENGEGYLIFGGVNGVKGWGAKQASLDPDALSGEDGVIVLGKAAGDSTGYGVGYLGDLNNDGYADFGITGHGGDPNGEVYVIYGNEFTGYQDSTLLTLAGTAPSRVLTVRGQEDTDEVDINLSTGAVSMSSGTFTSIDATDATKVEASDYEGQITLTGSSGEDTFFGGAGDDYAQGGQGDDYLEGGAGNDELWGGIGIDELSGGTGNDTLVGGASGDMLTSDLGEDVFLYTIESDMTNDTISDADWDFDKLQFDSVNFGLAAGTLDSGRFFVVTNYTDNYTDVTQDGAVFIYDDGAESLYYDDDGNDGSYGAFSLDITYNGNAPEYDDIELVNLA
ncbi:FecR domain-containing protein [Desulfovibrio ferrophilus]|uniref:Putative outer membrane adhesin like protein n=1 Tax=Desulfovibrio ferrophilus TaxID=241368 RepID=A0A2Z6B0K4_9BACT|nr:FecR domain-containing protein [Desulfovibrio ferrophilus]BBD09031.1 putative outer membrane adhesin like protein [Desulfovibrio ferrophilus]